MVNISNIPERGRRDGQERVCRDGQERVSRDGQERGHQAHVYKHNSHPEQGYKAEDPRRAERKYRLDNLQTWEVDKYRFKQDEGKQWHNNYQEVKIVCYDYRDKQGDPPSTGAGGG